MPVDLLVVCAHPDDETIGLSARLAEYAGRCLVVHTTDGAPKDLYDARRCGFATREEYARARRAELREALSLAGIAEEHCLEVGLADQEASYHLPHLTAWLTDLLRRTEPETVFTHPYEGGHPDHDATAFAVHHALRRVSPPPELREFTSYHAGPAGMETFTFLDDPGFPVPLTGAERERKRQMIDCFRTQREMLSLFPLEIERWRPAPAYDFRRPPHEGRLHYEQFSWGVNGGRWRELAATAMEEMR